MDREPPIKLSDSERVRLKEIVFEKRGSVGRLRRATLLLHAESQAEGIDFQFIARECGVSEQTVRRVCSQYLQGGLRASVFASRFTKIIRISDHERLTLHGIVSNPSSLQRNIKKARILLEADLQGENADIREIAVSAGTADRTVIDTLNLYLRSGLDTVLTPPCTFCFQLKKNDRTRLRECLRNKELVSKLNPNKYARLLILLNADAKRSNITLEEIATSAGVRENTVRSVCQKYRQSGLNSVLNLSPHRYRTPRRLHPVRLGSGDRSYLNKIASSREDTRRKRRAQILLLADENGPNLHNDEIAGKTGVRVQTVNSVCKRYVCHGLEKTFRQHFVRKTRRTSRRSTRIDRYRLDVRLSEKEQMELQKILLEPKCSKGRLNRAKILLAVNGLDTDLRIGDLAKKVGVSTFTIRSTCKRYLSEGFEAAINHKQMKTPSRTFTLDEKQEAKVVELFYNRPPQGITKWTLNLLTEQIVAAQIVPKVSLETIRKVLKKYGISLSVRS